MVKIKVQAMALLCSAALVFTGCSKDPNEKALKDAARCGGIHFKSNPRILMARDSSSQNGDASVALVVSVPESEVDSFKNLSKLPDFQPGPPDSWIDKATGKWVESNWFSKDLANGLNDSKPEQFQHLDQPVSETSYGKWVVIQEIENSDARIYIGIACF